MRILALLLFLSFASYAPPVQALTVSPHSFRLEDKREGNVLLGAEEAKIERGELYKVVLLLWGRLDVYGEVDEVFVLSGHVTFHKDSKLNKSLVVMGGSFDSESGAQVPLENVVARVPGPAWRLLRSAGNLWRDNMDWVGRASAAVVSCFLLWLTGWALFAFFPALQNVTTGSLAPFWPKNLILGIFGSVAACAGFVLLLVSIVGILLIPFYLLLLAFGALVSYLAAALWAGHRLLPPRPGRKLHPGGFFLGLLTLQFLWTVPIWWAWLPVLLLWTLSWGALVRASGKLWR